MTVSVVWHPACELHEPGPGHPEQPDRIRAVLAALRAPALVSRVLWSEARPADRAAIERVHAAPYVAALERLAARRRRARSPDLYLRARRSTRARPPPRRAHSCRGEACGSRRGATAYRAA